MIEVIDLFCGAGGVTTGIEKARYKGMKCAKVIACINHDPIAIESHRANHKGVLHFTEDIKTFDVTRFPAWSVDATKILWASLECTNFSNAKGGGPRDADSRTLAEHLYKYIDHLDPDYILIENVREFLMWGPLDGFGKPIKSKLGRDFKKWKRAIKSRGYVYDYRILNCADYGAHTSRKRLFIMFAKKGICPSLFPQPTHSKTGGNGLKKWRPVKQVLDFTDEGESIFTRKKPLAEKTLERIYAGLQKYVAGGDDSWILKYNSACNNTSVNKGSSVDQPGPTITTMPTAHLASVDKAFILKYNSTNGKTGKHIPPSVEDPAPVVSTQVRMGLVNVQKAFLAQYNSGSDKNRVKGIGEPCNTVSTANRFALVNAEFLYSYISEKPKSVDEPFYTITTQPQHGKVKVDFLVKYHGSGKNLCSVNDPASTLSTKDRLALVNPKFFIDEQYTSSKPVSIEKPGNALLTNPKQRLVRVEKSFLMDTNFNNVGNSIEDPSPTILASRRHHYLVNPQWFNKSASSVDSPCFTLIARIDKAPPCLVTTESGEVIIEIYETDSECTVKIKLFMAAYGITDIKLRMLRIHELLGITGLPKRYKLKGTQGDQKKFIGNAVPPIVPQRWIESLYPVILEYRELKNAA